MANIVPQLKVRFTIVIRHIIQSTTACLLAMTKGNLSVLTSQHWKIAFSTGLGAGLIALLVSYGNWVKFQTSRYGVAFIAFVGTFIADYVSHSSGSSWKETFATAIGAALLSLFVSFTPLDRYVALLQKEKIKENVT
ncbi:hypothetical protein TUM19329_16540 [Legionella antarctica]|uniref:Transmembrane protein n=1 Tax=Legionella antarctica TaxID=2708020 RepID=A0A6F8T510_9GAMM|nr:hypothetical protein [Legionella antarctica]BCA95293.1 hypothetical protein TUM19329_16540 [Legionella antarctica]